MSRWVLTFVGDGEKAKAILTTSEPLHRETVEHVQSLWDRWVKDEGQLMIIGDCVVEKVDRVELEISSDAIVVLSPG